MSSISSQHLAALVSSIKRLRNYFDAFSYLVFGGSFICAILTYCTFSSDSFDVNNSKTGFYLIYLDVIVILLIIYTVIRKFFNIFYSQKRGLPASKFHIKLVSTFSLLTIIPSVMMSVFAIVFFHGGMDSWFTQKNRTVLSESLRVAQAYLEEHRELIKDDAVAVAKMLETKLPILPKDFHLRSRFLKNMLRLRGLTEGLLLDKNLNVLARTDFSFSLEFQRLDAAVLDEALSRGVALLNINDKQHIFALTPLEFQDTMFLLVKKPIDERVIRHVENTKAAVREYFDVQSERKSLEIGFALLFLLTAILVVFSAIGIAITMASKIVTPISNLINASEKIRDGDLNYRASAKANYDELNILTKTFNEMAERIQEQHRDLIKINSDLDYRIQFTENVLYNISSGVIGLNNSLRIHIVNQSAQHMLGISNGSDVASVFPEIRPLLEKARMGRNTVEDNLTISLKDRELLLLVRVVYDPSRLDGFVITVDDLTEISLAQRKAAWLDVARSVAHEIKNPLTPIKLAAERLNRKYGPVLAKAEDQEIFKNLVITIIKHADNIKRLVDEFSTFARLPEPIKTRNDIVEICHSAIVFAQNTNNWINFSFETEIDHLEINCDENLIRQVLNNLLKNSANAIKYAIEGGMNIESPNIKLSVYRREAGLISLIVEDNGPGFSDEYKRRLLQPYFSLTPNGTGLGLVISNKIISDHGGAMHIANSPTTGGAVVDVHLPYSEK